MHNMVCFDKKEDAMSEEAQYTASVKEYQNKSRFPTLSRYRDLISFVRAAFSDGKISDSEMNQIEKVEHDILLEYQVAADVFDKMPSTAPQKAAAQKLLNHLHRCNVFMNFAKGQAKVKHDSERPSVENEKRQQDVVVERIVLDDNKVLKVGATVAQLNLLRELQTPRQRIDAELPKIRRDLARMSPEERAEYEAQINAIIDQIAHANLELVSVSELNQLLGFERYLEEERERTRE